MLKDRLSPSTLPSVMVDLPIIWLVVSPVSFVPSTLKVKVRSMGPLPASAVPFQLPAMSAAEAVMANRAIRTSRYFILGFSLGVYGLLVYFLIFSVPGQ